MIALLKTSERISSLSYINNYVFQRHLFAYQTVLKNRMAGKQVLELGCGEGYGMEMLSPQTDFYLAVDKKKPSSNSLSRNVVFQQCRLPDLTGIQSNSFDTVICFQVIEHIKNDNRLLGEIKRVLKPGGVLILTTPNKLTSLTRNPFHVREYPPQQMRSLISGYFNTYTVQGIYGNDLVLKYYNENKKAVERITRYDIFNLQYHLPAFLLKSVYRVFNIASRSIIVQKAPDITANISYNDFYLDELSDDCLDYFVMATKES